MKRKVWITLLVVLGAVVLSLIISVGRAFAQTATWTPFCTNCHTPMQTVGTPTPEPNVTWIVPTGPMNTPVPSATPFGGDCATLVPYLTPDHDWARVCGYCISTATSIWDDKATEAALTASTTPTSSPTPSGSETATPQINTPTLTPTAYGGIHAFGLGYVPEWEENTDYEYQGIAFNALTRHDDDFSSAEITMYLRWDANISGCWEGTSYVVHVYGVPGTVGCLYSGEEMMCDWDDDGAITWTANLGTSFDIDQTWTYGGLSYRGDGACGSYGCLFMDFIWSGAPGCSGVYMGHGGWSNEYYNVTTPTPEPTPVTPSPTPTLGPGYCGDPIYDDPETDYCEWFCVPGVGIFIPGECTEVIPKIEVDFTPVKEAVPLLDWLPDSIGTPGFAVCEMRVFMTPMKLFGLTIDIPAFLAVMFLAWYARWATRAKA